jgi:predicted ATPase
MFLKRFGVKDFKALAGKHIFNFRPITVLIGKNSSGKSSLTKAILILGENYLKTGDFEELSFSDSRFSLGDFKSVLNNETTDKSIEFILPLELDFVKVKFNLHLVYSIDNSEAGEKAFLSHVKISDEEKTIIYAGYYNLNSYTKVKKAFKDLWPEQKMKFPKTESLLSIKKKYSVCYHNPEYFLDHLNNEILKFQNKNKIKDSEGLPFVTLSPEEINQLNKQEGNSFEEYKNEYETEEIPNDALESFIDDPDLIKFYKARIIYHGGLGLQKVDFTTELPKFQTSQYANDIESLFELKVTLSDDYVGFLDTINYDFNLSAVCETLTNLYSYESVHAELGAKAKYVVEDMYSKNLKKAIIKTFDGLKKINYLSPYRGVTKRIYYSETGGSQFAGILDKFCSQKVTQTESDFVNYWLKKFDAGDKLSVKRYQGAATSVFIEKRGKKLLLADLGYGFHQIIPIIIQIILNYRGSQNKSTIIPMGCEENVIIIEEPESNLHPNLQPLLADLFIDAASKFNIQFILETHSEYLVRKIQYLTRKGKITQEDVNIYYFNNENKKDQTSEIYEIKLLNDGALSNEFGPGFLDEADNLAIDLFNLNKSSSN